MKTSYYKLLCMIEKKIAPKKVKYDDMIFEWSSDNYKRWDVFDEVHFLSSYLTMDEMIKDEIEILDDEEKGLPEKLDIEQDSPTSNYYIRNEYGTKCGLTKHSKIIADKLNEIIDYLEKQRKGE